MSDNDYDDCSRHLARRAGALLMHWLLRLDATHIRFDSWLDSVLTLPGTKERVCDAVARLADLDRGGLPTACLIEFQTEPDPDMFGRLLVAGGICWLTVKPSQLPGDRYELAAVVVNLTGQGDCARHMSLGTTEWKLTPRELNLQTLDAAVVLEEIASGKAPGEVLAWIPVMQNGGEPGIIQRWRQIAEQETDLNRRGDFALAGVFAGAVGRQDVWRQALEGFQMNESPVARQWRAEARLEGKAEAVLRLVQRWGVPVPEDLAATIRSSTDSAQLDRWLDLAVAAPTLEQFRQVAGL